jgi:hypothetical protein
MGWIESLMCWFRPSHWRDRHAQQSNPNPASGPHGYTEPQHSAADETETAAHDVPEFTDHDVSDPGVT